MFRPLNPKNKRILRTLGEGPEPESETPMPSNDPDAPLEFVNVTRGLDPDDARPATQESILERLLVKLTDAAAANTLTPSQLETILTRVGITSADAMRMSLKPENADHPHISAFFTAQDAQKYGDWTKKPKLTRKTFFCGTEEKEDRLTPAEIEAYNALQAPFTACRNGKWTATVKKNGQQEELHVMLPCFTYDERADMGPSLLLTLLELGGGPSTADLSSLIRQLDYLKAKEVKRGGSVADLEKELQAL